MCILRIRSHESGERRRRVQQFRDLARVRASVTSRLQSIHVFHAWILTGVPMPQHYRMTAHAGAFQRDAVVTDDQIKGTGANIDDWKRLGVIQETEAPTTTGVPEGEPDHPIS